MTESSVSLIKSFHKKTKRKKKEKKAQSLNSTKIFLGERTGLSL